MPRSTKVGILTKEVQFRYHKKGPLLGKVKERLELTGDLRVGSKVSESRSVSMRRHRKMRRDP